MVEGGREGGREGARVECELYIYILYIYTEMRLIQTECFDKKREKVRSLG